MKTTRAVFALIAVAVVLPLGSASADIGYHFVVVGNPGNADDIPTGYTNGYGGVSYKYAIGTYDVTLNQYTAFLNAVATTSDTNGLYDSSLEADNDPNVQGIQQNGTSGSYSYSVIGDGNRPVTYVNWLNAARFANWMHNGQPTGMGEVAGSTETGAYTMTGDDGNGFPTGYETRNAGAKYWIPSPDEWYKAAYYDPNYGGTGVGGYWAYPTKSNSAPGNNYLTPGLANQANYITDSNGFYSVTQSSDYDGSQNYLTPVGAFTASASPYGTYDQAGNVYQWNEGIIGDNTNGYYRGKGGGAWISGANGLQSYSTIGTSYPTTQIDNCGFRIASAIPTLTIVRTTNQGLPAGTATVTLSWPTLPAGWTLQQSTSITSPSWTSVTTSPTVVNGRNQVALTTSTTSKHLFYQLAPP